MRSISMPWAGICLLAILLLPAESVLASMITVSAGDVTAGDLAGCSLTDAITSANQSTTTNTTVAGCAPTGTPNGGDGGIYTTGTVIKLAAGTYTLTQVNNSWYGANGLPAIATDITIVGDPDGSVIERSTAAGTPTFRFFFVGGGQSLSGYNPPAGAPANLPGPGKLTLVNLTLEHGLFRGGDGITGGGGAAGLGGAIYSQGMLELNGVTLAFNEAVGGNANSGTQGGGGGFYTSADSSGKGGSGGIAGNGGASTPTVIGSDGGNGGIGGGGGSSGLTGAGGTGGYGGGGGYGDYWGGAGGFGGGGGQSQIHTGASGFGGGIGGLSNGGGGAGFGGAIFNEGGTVSLLNSTITGNSVHGGQGNSVGVGYGAALFNLNGTVTIRYSTLANNSVDGRIATGGAVYNLYLNPVGSPAADVGMTATVTVNSSILANSLQGATLVSDCENNAGTFTSGYDVVQTDASPRCSFINNDQAADAQLSALADNGGPTHTLALTRDSVAVDMGDSGAALGPVPLVDQRGFPRDSHPDAGSYEYQHLAVTGFADVTAPVGEAIPPQAFTLRGTGVLTVSAQSSNPDLLPDEGITVSTDCGIDDNHRDCTLMLAPVTGQLGTTTITVTVADEYGENGKQSFALTVDTAPIAVNGSISTKTGKPVSGTLKAIDNDSGQTLTFSIETEPRHGTVALTEDTGAFTYTPDAGYAGSDSFAYTVNDGYKTSAAAVVSITVAAASTGDNDSEVDDAGSSGKNTRMPSLLSAFGGGGGGGGAFGLFGFALLGLPLLGRRRHT